MEERHESVQNGTAVIDQVLSTHVSVTVCQMTVIMCGAFCQRPVCLCHGDCLQIRACSDCDSVCNLQQETGIYLQPQTQRHNNTLYWEVAGEGWRVRCLRAKRERSRKNKNDLRRNCVLQFQRKCKFEIICVEMTQGVIMK